MPAGPSRKARRSPLELWHLLSLDAPTVAATWTWFIARCSGLHLPWTSPAAMFVAVWMLYAADRLLDARALSGGDDLEERHYFHGRHRDRFLLFLALSSLLLAVVLLRLSHVELRLFASLGSLLFAYFFLIHLWPFQVRETMARSPRLPKEFAVGVFFPAAVFIPTVARLPSLRAEMLPAALLLAAVCTLNCLYVYKWEHPRADRHAHWTTRLALRQLTSVCLLTLAACAVVCLVATRSQLPGRHVLMLPAVACAGSIALFLLFDASRRKLSAVMLRALVDAALLTPLLLLPVLVR